MENDTYFPESFQIKKDLTTSALKANVVAGIVALPLMLAFSIPYYFIWGDIISIQVILEGRQNALYILPIIIAGIIAHELLHGLGFALYAKKGFKSIKFGVIWHMLTPYCHCSEPLRLPAFLFAGLLPAVILGISPCAIALVIGHMPLMVFGLFFTLAAGGDFLIAWMLRKEHKKDWVQDHPDRIGCVILEEKKGDE